MADEPAQLQLWINENGHFFVDVSLDVQVGQTWRKDDGSWTVEVNGQYVSAPDLEAAKRLFVDLYDPSQVGPILGGEPYDEAEVDDDELYDEDDSDGEAQRAHRAAEEEGFEIINLT
ncbi:MAG TPA: hypothetical protein VNS34_26960 [Rhizobiaceae bacterium]|nr:hypothetical protein [Rhizobiaceae bacterium]